MEEFKGTKGEWTVKRERGYDIDVTNKDGDICWLGLSEFTDETKLANAKLIAAAPELLKALLETDKDLCILWAQILDLEKTNPIAEGLSNLIKQWRERNKEAINKALN